MPFFWSQHYDVTIRYVGHAERWDRVQIDGSLDAHDATVRFFQAETPLAVATVGRDRASLEAELALKLNARRVGCWQRPDGHLDKSSDSCRTIIRAPDYGFPHGDARLDLTDLYVFPKPEDAGRFDFDHERASISCGEPGRTDDRGAVLTDAMYEFKIDTDGDAVADVAYRVRFSATASGQSASVRRAEGATGSSPARVYCSSCRAVLTGLDAKYAQQRRAPTGFSQGGAVSHSSSTRRRALNNLQFTGDDFFANGDVWQHRSGTPNSAFGQGPIALWAWTGGPSRRRMGSSRPWRAALAIQFLDLVTIRSISRRGASERCPFHSDVRALSGAYGGARP